VGELRHPLHRRRDALLHRAKRRGELADLVLARTHGDRLIVADRDATRGGREFA
jgi:hypothetical protein